MEQNPYALIEKLKRDLERVERTMNQSGGSGIAGAIGDAKGDLIGFSAADTPVRIPAAASNGSVLTSDTTQTGGVKWKPSGEVASGYAQITATKSDTLNNGATGTAAISITVTGDGVNAMMLEFWCREWVCTNGTGNGYIVIRDGSTAGSDVMYAHHFFAAGSNHPVGGMTVKRRYPAFSGSKTFVAAQFNENIGAGAILQIAADATVPAYLRAEWA